MSSNIIKYLLIKNNFLNSYYSTNRNILLLNNLLEQRKISTYSRRQTVSTPNLDDTLQINLKEQKKKLNLDLTFENSQLVNYSI